MLHRCLPMILFGLVQLLFLWPDLAEFLSLLFRRRFGPQSQVIAEILALLIQGLELASIMSLLGALAMGSV